MRLTDHLTTEMSYAIYGSQSEFGPEGAGRQLTPTVLKPRYEARAIYELLRDAGVKIFPVAADSPRTVAGDQAYPSIDELPQKVDVLILTLPNEQGRKAIEAAATAGIMRIWFQPGTDSAAALEMCRAKGISAIKGCALRHRIVSGCTRFISPCFYMGLGAAKLPVRADAYVTLP